MSAILAELCRRFPGQSPRRIDHPRRDFCLFLRRDIFLVLQVEVCLLLLIRFGALIGKDEPFELLYQRMH